MSHTILTGQEFNQQYHGKLFVKLTNDSENHNKYQFQTGLNIDSILFDPTGECRPGGIYFSLLEKMPLWLNYTGIPMIYRRFVTIPDDALVYTELDKFKADRIILSERQEIVGLEQWKDESYCLEAVKQNGNALQFVAKQTPEVCLEAVKQNGLALQYVTQQNTELCLEAVKQNGHALSFVTEPTPELCLVAVKQNGLAIQYIKQQTSELCLAAVKQEGWSLEHVLEQTRELCLEAVKHNGRALLLVKEQTEELCLEAVKQNGLVLEHVKIQTDELCLEAIKQNSEALKYVKTPSKMTEFCNMLKNKLQK